MDFIFEYEREIALNKFVNDSLINENLFYISHRCHYFFYYVISQFELVLRFENDNKIIYKNDNRETKGGYNALINCHLFNYCYLHFS